MKKTLTIVSLLVIITNTVIAQDKPISNKVNVKNGIYINKSEQHYTIHYIDISEQDKGVENSFTISKEKLFELHKTLLSGFKQMPEKPISFNLQNDELRLYFRKKLGEAQVEIVHENLESEKTGTLSWLSAKEVEKLLLQ